MLQMHHVSKSFGPRQVLDDVSLTIEPGVLTGFVGSNGAGKTTTMRIAMGLLDPDRGHVTWQGRRATAHDRRSFGYMPEERGLYPKQPVREQLRYFGRLHGLSPRRANERADDLIARFGLTERAGTKVEELSLGNQQRVQIAVALMAEPPVLIMDEPFSGLDPQAIGAMGDLIRECATQGVAVLFSSHQLDLVERLCDRIVVINQGRVIAAGTADELRADRARVIRLDAVGLQDAWDDVLAVPGLQVQSRTPTGVLVTPTDPGAAEAMLRRALSYGDVTHYGEVVEPLSTIFEEMVH